MNKIRMGGDPIINKKSGLLFFKNIRLGTTSVGLPKVTKVKKKVTRSHLWGHSSKKIN